MMKKLSLVLVCLLGVSGLSGMEKEVKSEKSEKLKNNGGKVFLPSGVRFKKRWAWKDKNDGSVNVFYFLNGALYSLLINDGTGMNVSVDRDCSYGVFLGKKGENFFIEKDGTIKEGSYSHFTILDISNLKSPQIQENSGDIYLKSGDKIIKIHDKGSNTFSEILSKKSNDCSDNAEIKKLFNEDSEKELSSKELDDLGINEFFEFSPNYTVRYLGIAAFSAAVASVVTAAACYLWNKKKAESNKNGDQEELAEDAKNVETEEQTAESVVS